MTKGKFKIQGLDKLKAQLKKMQTAGYSKELFIEEVCKRVPETSHEKHNFKFIDTSATTFELDETSISPELYSKIVTAFQQQ